MVITPYPYNPYRTQSEVPDSWWEEHRNEIPTTYFWSFPDIIIVDEVEYIYYRKVNLEGFPLDEIDPKFFPLPELVRLHLAVPHVSSQSVPEGSQWDDYLTYFFDVLDRKHRATIGLHFYRISYIVLPKTIFEEIQSLITRLNIKSYDDLLFYLNAKIQEDYLREIEYHQKQEQQKLLKEFPQECQNLVRIVEKNYEAHRVFPDPTNRSEKPTWCYYDEKNKKYIPHPKPSRLNKIVFHFDNEKPITIRDGLLLSEIMDGIVHMGDEVYYTWRTGKGRDWFNTEEFLKWKEHTLGLPHLLYPQHKKNQFKDNIAVALDKFLQERVKLKPTQSREVIAHILEWALIDIKKRQHSDTPADVETLRKRIKRKGVNT